MKSGESSEEWDWEAFGRQIAKLKYAVCDFAKENFKELKEKRIAKKFPELYWEDLVSGLVEERSKYQKKKIVKNTRKKSTKEKSKSTKNENEEKKNKSSGKPQRGRKRKESANNAKEDVTDEKPNLKKTKKS